MTLSLHFQSRAPSAIRLTQIEFLKRTDSVVAVNTAIGNVSLPMHPAMQKRMFDLKSHFQDGVVKYTTTVGEKETTQAFLHLIAASGFPTRGLHAQITEGASAAMELVVLGASDKPLLMIDPTYSNYSSMLKRVGKNAVTVTRQLDDSGHFCLPPLSSIEQVIEKTHPGALLIIPYDNPTGQFFNQKTLNDLGKLCVKYNLWMISDEAYREVFYTKDKTSSVWGISESEVPGITGRRISIESSSKVWNACGLRIGALVTDNVEFHTQAVAENTANLCANAIGQYIFGALLHESKEALQSWFEKQRAYYGKMAHDLTTDLKQKLPKLIVSKPDSSLYTVVDLRNFSINASDFVLYCARFGSVQLNGVPTTLLMAPMDGFYEKPDIGKTQMRIAYVEPPEVMRQVPTLFAQLLKDFSKEKLSF